MKLLPQTLGLLCVAYLTLGLFSEAQKGEQPHRDINIEAACNTAFARQKSEKVAKTTPFAMLMEQGSLSHDCRIVSFFATNLPSWDEPDSKPVYIARRWHRHITSQPQSTFATSEDCDGMSMAVGALADFRVPAISVPGQEPFDSPAMIVADGSSFAFWSDRLLNGERRVDYGDVALTASNNDAMAELTEKIENALSKCWRSAEPNAAPR